MADSSISSERSTDATGYSLVTGAQAEQALRSAIQRLERLGDSSLELAQALIKLGTLRQEKGSHAEADELFQKALDISERTLGSEHIELVQALTSLAGARIVRGSPESAEPLLNRALTISTRYLGDDHPDLVIMVNDFARMYLKAGDYSFAEPLLQRLLAMKRSKGDDHPEVATVLASLAAVHRARGQHESAEGLWRRVLAIRERTLAPNHFAQATALEHLADVCAARGKIGEALQLFQRAQMIRELTLGTDHSSLRTLRERIADLELQASDDSFEAPHAHAPGAQPNDLRPTNQSGINIPVARRAKRESRGLARMESAMPFVERELPRPPAVDEEDRPATPRTAPFSTPEEREAAAIAYRAALLDERQNADDADEGEAIGLAGGVLASVTVLMRKHHREALAVAGVMAFLVIAFATSTRASSEVDQTIAEPPSAAAVSLTGNAPQPQPATSNQLNVPAPNSAALIRKISPPPPRPIEQRNPQVRSERRAERAIVSIPTVSSPSTNRFDSLVRSAGVSARGLSESFLAPPALSTPSIQRPKFDYGESGAPQRSRARLIGSMPTLHYPEQLHGVEAKVLVRFNVDTGGHPEMATFSAVNSPNALLTEAIRKVIQGLRFEPARTGGPESKPIVDGLEVDFVFSPTKR